MGYAAGLVFQLLPAVSPWAGFILSIGLSFLICKMGIIIACTYLSYCEDHIRQCMYILVLNKLFIIVITLSSCPPPTGSVLRQSCLGSPVSSQRKAGRLHCIPRAAVPLKQSSWRLAVLGADTYPLCSIDT